MNHATAPVKGYTNLIRDLNSGAIINTNVRGAEMARQRNKAFTNQNKKIETTAKELDMVKSELSEIKDMLKTLLTRDTNNG